MKTTVQVQYTDLFFYFMYMLCVCAFLFMCVDAGINVEIRAQLREFHSLIPM